MESARLDSGSVFSGRSLYRLAALLNVLANAFHGAAASNSKQGDEREEGGSYDDFFHGLALTVVMLPVLPILSHHREKNQKRRAYGYFHAAMCRGSG